MKTLSSSKNLLLNRWIIFLALFFCACEAKEEKFDLMIFSEALDTQNISSNKDIVIVSVTGCALADEFAYFFSENEGAAANLKVIVTELATNAKANRAILALFPKSMEASIHIDSLNIFSPILFQNKNRAPVLALQENGKIIEIDNVRLSQLDRYK